MGDRTWVNAQFHPEDIGKMRELVLTYIEVPTAIQGIDAGATTVENSHCWTDNEWRFIRESGFVDFNGYDVNGGGWDDFEVMAAAGVRFVMTHGNGAEYASCTAVALDGEMRSCFAIPDLGPVIPIGPKGLPARSDKENARKFYQLERKLTRMFEKKAEEYESV